MLKNCKIYVPFEGIHANANKPMYSGFTDLRDGTEIFFYNNLKWSSVRSVFSSTASYKPAKKLNRSGGSPLNRTLMFPSAFGTYPLGSA